MKSTLAAIVSFLYLCPLAYAANSPEQKAFMDAATENIEKYIAVPCETPQTAEIHLQLEGFPNGYLKSIEVMQSSGYPAYDKAVLKAVVEAQPFEANNPALLSGLRNSIFYFRPDIPTYRCNLQPLNGEIPNLQINGLPPESGTETK